MIDPLDSLAFSMQSNRGVYAVLLGSGISKAARIPTGWDVTLDLVRKLAAVRNETPDQDPESWFRDKFGTEPDYSHLLDQLAKTQPERQQLLRGYWEPREEQREEGEKEPTAAHHAIAALASRGFIKVIITTNFDKLMERALSGAGIEAMVLSNKDQIRGAPPLDHMQHLVFTAGNTMSTVSVLPAVSDAVTVAVAVLEAAVSGVPLIAPVPEAMLSPDGRPAALYPSMPLPPEGVIAVIATPTCSDGC